MNTFPGWLLGELKRQGISQSDLARLAGISTGSVSDIVSGRRKVGPDLAKAIAVGLKLPVEQVYRAAGILPPEKANDEQVEEILHLSRDLSKEDRRTVIEFIRMLDRLRGNKK
jgi:transcriptional regulator with XRE-family HTH domain